MDHMQHHPPPPPQQQQQQLYPHDYSQQQQQQQHAHYHQQQQYGGSYDSSLSNNDGPVKLFVGQVPRTMEEDDLRPVLEAFGPLDDIVIIRDKLTGAHRGCAFASFVARDAAERAITELHNKVTLPQSMNPLQVRPAEGQAGASQEHKLFIGMIPKSADEPAIREVFELFGAIEEVYILRHPATGQSKGCAFLKFKDRASALQAIDDVNGNVTMDRGTSPLVVKFADSRRQRLQRARTMAAVAATAYWPMPPPTANLPFPQLQQLQQQYMQQMQAFGAQAAGLNMNPAAVGAVGSSPVGGPGSPTNSFLYYNPYAFAATNAYAFNGLSGAGNNAMGFDSPGLNSPTGGIGSPGLGAVGNNPLGSPSAGGVIDNPGSNKAPRASSQLEGPAGANLFIYHLPHDLTDADLATAFAPFGAVISAKVYMDKITGESKGFGFVSYDSAGAADAAIASMNGFQIGSKRLKVQHKRIHQRDYLGHSGHFGGHDAEFGGVEFQSPLDAELTANDSGSGSTSGSVGGNGNGADATAAALEDAVHQLRISDP